ncbi:MAG: hypothetical protein ABI616_03680 [Pseudomonadota bacterium]
MKRSTVIVVALIVAAGSVAYARIESIFLQSLRSIRSEVRWVPSSEASVDLDGDWMPDNMALGNVTDGVVLAIKSTATGKFHYVDFRVEKGDPDAFCAVPVKLSKVALSCSANAAGMPGCKESPRTYSLVLNDGSCAPINVYWDHEQKGPVWWRAPAAGQ